jgi:anhydro-N-acetylmuramic acid kinase
MAASRAVIGLMSGTSLDGIDVAYIDTDGEGTITPGPWLTDPYDPVFRERLNGLLDGNAPSGEVAAVERDMTLLHVSAVRKLINRDPACRPTLVGLHGHTILHRPEERRTLQIGDPALLARELGLPVVSDFRSADVIAGGQGAPLAPIYHRALVGRADKPVVILNIGGVANLTWVGHSDDELLAFDAGPGNALLDDWMLRHTGKPCDLGGKLAASGRADDEAVRRFMTHPYFSKSPPKSLDRNEFLAHMPRGLTAADGAATLAAMTVAAIAHSITQLPSAPIRVLVTGGGRHNPTLMRGLSAALAMIVAPIEQLGWDGDALEAQAFAYMAVRSIAGLPISFPGTTGVPVAMCGGSLTNP